MDEPKTSTSETATTVEPLPQVNPVPKPAAKKKPKKPSKTKFANLKWKIADLEMPEDWNREKLGDIKDLVASIREKGLIQPLGIRLKDKNKAVLVDGMRRLAACKQLKWTEVDVYITKDQNTKSARSSALIANVLREDNTPYEIAKTFDDLITKEGMTSEQIAKEFGKSPSFVSQHIAIFKQSKALQNALKNQKIPVSAIRHFTKLDQEKHGKFYEKMSDKLLAGASAQDVGDEIDTFIEKERQKEAAKAAKEGKTVKAPSRRGAAAHKKKASPQLQITDYTQKEARDLVKPISKPAIIERLEYYTEQLRNAVKKQDVAYYQGYVDGLEMAAGVTDWAD